MVKRYAPTNVHTFTWSGPRTGGSQSGGELCQKYAQVPLTSQGAFQNQSARTQHHPCSTLMAVACGLSSGAALPACRLNSVVTTHYSESQEDLSSKDEVTY